MHGSRMADPKNLPELPKQIADALVNGNDSLHLASQQLATAQDSAQTQNQTSPTRIFPQAHEGQRNATAAKVSGTLCANMNPKLWESAGWNTLLSWNHSRCYPPLDIPELRGVWNSITATHLRSRTQKSNDEYTSDGVKQSKSSSSKPITILPWSAFRRQQFAEPEWIVESLIPEKRTYRRGWSSGVLQIPTSPQT